MLGRIGCLALGAGVLLLSGCAKPPEQGPGLSAYAPDVTPAHVGYSATQAVLSQDAPRAAEPAPRTMREPRVSSAKARHTVFDASLAGRTLVADRVFDLRLAPGEVILTFDDGPMPGQTGPILDTLDAYGVKATFLMVGQQAQAHPELARRVAREGHTIGAHTFDHANLTHMPPHQATSEILAGRRAVSAALAPLHRAPSRFFRFPYLAQTQLLRTDVGDRNMIVLDVDVDSNDWFRETPDQVLARTLARLDAKGRGIVLFHDIHARTAAMLPRFLDALAANGYRVVTLRSKGTTVFDEEIVAARD